MIVLIIILLLTSFIFTYYELEKKQNYLNQEKSIYLIILLYLLNKLRSNNDEYLHLKRLIRVSLICVCIYYSFKLNKLNSYITLTNILMLSVIIYIAYDIHFEEKENDNKPTYSPIPKGVSNENFTTSKEIITLKPSEKTLKEIVTLEPLEKEKRLNEIKKTVPPMGTEFPNTMDNDPMNFGSKKADVLPKKKKVVVISKVNLKQDEHVVKQLQESYKEAQMHRKNQEEELKKILQSSREKTKKRLMGGRRIIRPRRKTKQSKLAKDLEKNEGFANMDDDIEDTRNPRKEINYITYDKTADL